LLAAEIKLAYIIHLKAFLIKLEYVLNYLLTPWSRDLLEKLTSKFCS